MQAQLKALIIASALPGLLACSGSQKTGGRSSVASSDAPKWVHRGTRVIKGSIYGVGSVEGVANDSLAQTTATNRGIAEISKILETYSASLMKDYQSSTSFNGQGEERQRVESAIKTFSANLITGAERKGLFYDKGKNMWWALVELNFERAKEVTDAKEKMPPGKTRDWVDQNGGRIFDDMAGDEPPPPPPSSGNNNPPPPKGGTTAPPPPAGPPAKVGGPAPGWTQGNCDRAKYLCGVGDGPNRKAADIDARAELARIFKSNVASVATSFQGAAQTLSSATGEDWVEVQKVTSYSMVSTDKVVEMSQILERWDDGKGMSWSLAVINRNQAINALTDRIRQQDGIVKSQMGVARGTQDAIARLKAVKMAAVALAKREAMNSDLRVIRTDGKGIPSPVSLAEVTGLLAKSAAALRIGLAVGGAGADRVQACIEDALTKRGYEIQANIDEDEEDVDIEGSFDVLIKGKIKNEKRGKIAGGQVVQTTLTLKLINGKNNRVLRTFRGSQKGTRPTVRAAASTSAFKVCQKQVPKMIKDIDRYFSK